MLHIVYMQKFKEPEAEVKLQIVSLISSVAAGFSRHSMPPPASNPDLWPFDLETGMRVASKVGDLPFKFGHARPWGSRIIRYVRDRRTDGQKQRLLLFPYGQGHNKKLDAPCLWKILLLLSLKVTEGHSNLYCWVGHV